MRAVNLLPRDVDRQRSGGRVPLVVAGAGIAAVTIVAFVLSMNASSSVSDRRSQLASVEAAVAAVPSTQATTAVAPGTIAQERTDRVMALSAALRTRVPVDRLLRDLAYVLPEDVWLTGLTATAPAAAAPAAPAGSAAPGFVSAPSITIQGATYSHQSVARVLARLAALPSLTGVRLTASARVEPAVAPATPTSKKSKKKKAKKPKAVVAFTISAQFRPGA